MSDHHDPEGPEDDLSLDLEDTAASLAGEMLGPRQAALVDSLTCRLHHGPSFSDNDLTVLHHVLDVLWPDGIGGEAGRPAPAPEGETPWPPGL